MRQKQSLRDTFFGLKGEQQLRPTSVATEFMDTDWDDDEDEIVSEFEENSPRVSVNSVGPVLRNATEIRTMANQCAHSLDNPV